MSAKNIVPGHFGPPEERTEVRLFGRWTLWVRYTWVRQERAPVDEAFDPVEAAAIKRGLIKKMMDLTGAKPEHRVDPPKGDPELDEAAGLGALFG